MTVKLSKGKLIKVNWGKHAEEVKRIWEERPTYSSKSLACKLTKIKRLFDYDGSNLVGKCSHCNNLNSHILKQRHSTGAIVITRFCEEHAPL